MPIKAIGGEITSQDLNDNFSYHDAQLADIAINVKNYDKLKVAIAAGYDYQPCFTQALADLDAAGGGTLLVPAGEYLIANTIEMKYDGCHLMGVGYGEPNSTTQATTIKKGFNGIAISIKDPSGGATLRTTVSRLNIDGDNYTGDGIYSYKWHYGVLRDVNVYDNKQTGTNGDGAGIHLDYSYTTFLENVQSSRNNINYLIENVSHNVVGIRCYSTSADNEGFYLKGSSNHVVFFGSAHEQSATYGVRVEHGVHDCLFDGFYGEADGNVLVNNMVYVNGYDSLSNCQNVSFRNIHIRITNLYKIPIVFRSYIYGARAENINIQFDNVTIDSSSRGILVGWSAGAGEVKGTIIENVHAELVNCTGSGIGVVAVAANAQRTNIEAVTSNDPDAYISATAKDNVRTSLIRGNYVGEVSHQNFEILSAEPNSATTQNGTLAYADGVNWNPGGKGEGLYYKDSTGTWMKITAT